MKVMTIVGTRPELIKLCCVIKELDAHVDHVLVHTGQNYDYELNQIFFDQLGVRKPDHFLDAAGATAAETIGKVIALADGVLAAEQPDAVLLLGDTNSCLSVIPAKRRKIPVFHMEAGNRCFDERVPEEINRRIVDHSSDINLTYTEHARRYLLAEGFSPERIIKTGSPMREVLNTFSEKIASSTILSELAVEVGQYFVVSAHREENVDDPANLRNLLEALNAIVAEYQLPIIFSTHPRTRQRLENVSDLELDSRIRLMKPLGFFDYIALQKQAACVVSDSGTITEESSILDFPAITIRQAHERPEGMDEGTLIMSGLTAENVLSSIRVVMAHAQADERRFKLVEDYKADNVSQKVVRIILSYTEYVNRVVWRK